MHSHPATQVLGICTLAFSTWGLGVYTGWQAKPELPAKVIRAQQVWPDCIVPIPEPVPIKRNPKIEQLEKKLRR